MVGGRAAAAVCWCLALATPQTWAYAPGGVRSQAQRSCARASALRASADAPHARAAPADGSAVSRRLLVLAALASPAAAWASGGATAGKYTSIPMAKRRYYGRVQEAVHEFVLLEPEIKSGADSAAYKDFFGDNMLIKSASKKSACVGDEKQCTSPEKRTSRWADMQLTMFLLGNAFRIDASKAPERIKQVQQARRFFKEVEGMQLAAKKGDGETTRARYDGARALLDEYLDAVDLPPSSYDVYKSEFDTMPVKLCASGTFCI